MKTRDRWEFLRCLAALITYASTRDLMVIATDFKRTRETQQHLVETGKSKTLNSAHLYWLAIDLAILEPDGITIEWRHRPGDAYEQLGNYWKTLHPRCQWGGDFGRSAEHPGWDPYHFGFTPPTALS